jgi:hypothetical protein
MRTAEDVLAIARELADEVLFPDAMRVDRLDVLPVASACPGRTRGGIALTGRG